MELIDKSALVAEIEKLKEENKPNSKSISEYIKGGIYGFDLAIEKALSIVNTIEVKEVDLEEEIEKECEKVHQLAAGKELRMFAKHFFELGMAVSNPITAEDRGTAEEIIINLKRIESDYRIDLTKEIEWLRNKAHKGE